MTAACRLINYTQVSDAVIIYKLFETQIWKGRVIK